MTPKWSRFIPYPPTITDDARFAGISTKQNAFLLLPTPEALYGGAAGGGKSEVLLAGATQYVDDFPTDSLLLRRTYRDLDKPGGLMFRAREWFAGTEAHWDGVNYRWTFPSRATINFGYLEHPGDELKYQCFTPDHEVLTTDGWIPVADVEVGDVAATMDPETREMSYQPVMKSWSYDYDGEIVEGGWKPGSHISFAVTPNHSVWASTERVTKLKEYTANELPYVARIPQWAIWDGGDPPHAVSFTSDGHNGRTVTFDPEVWAGFLGWYIAEGSTDTSRWGIGIAQQKEVGRARVEALLVNAGVNFHVEDSRYSFNNKALVLWLRENVGRRSYDKRLPADVKQWPRRHLRILITALLDGDGTWYSRLDDDIGRQGVFITSSSQLADDICDIGIKAGYRTSKTVQAPHPPGSLQERTFGNRIRYRVNLVLRDTDSMLGGNIRIVPYTGKVHCVTVPPYHIVLIRHRGKVSWSGQSSEYHFVGFDELTQFPEHQYLYLFSRMRKLKGTPVPLRMRAATNPGGPGHEWVRKRFNLPEGPPAGSGRVFIPSQLRDNPFLDHDEYERGLQQLGAVTRAQLLAGDWSATSTGGYFDASKYIIIGWSEVPRAEAFTSIIRYWDLATTEPTESNPDPDYTVGLKIGRTFHGADDPELPDWYIFDANRFRAGPGTVEQRIKGSAQRDTKKVTQWIEQEKGAAGKHLVNHYRRNVLRGFNVRGYPVEGSKEERAAIVAARVNEGRVFLVDGEWIPDFVAESAVFPMGSHDDQVDAFSYGYLALEREYQINSPGKVETVGKAREPVRRGRRAEPAQHYGY